MKELQLIAFNHVIDYFKDKTVHYLNWPKSWIDSLKTDRAYQLNKKLSRLTQQLYGLFPEIIFIQNDVRSIKGDAPWIVSSQILNKEQLFYIVEEFLRLEDSLEDEPLIWSKGTVEEVLIKKEEQAKYTWVPALVAHTFSKRKVELTTNQGYNGKIMFYPIYFGNYFEAFSEPIRKGPKSDYFSYAYRFELITRGTENIPLLKVSTAIRRYYQVERDFIPMRKDKKVSVLVSVENQFEKKERSFSKVKTKIGKNGVQLVDEYRQFFDHIMLEEPPEISDIFHSPKKYIESESVKAYIIYNENTFNQKGTNVERGLGLPERVGLIDTFCKSFPEFKMVPPLKQIRTSFNNNTYPMIPPIDTKELELEVFSNSRDFIASLEEVLLDKKIVTEKKGEHQFHLNTEPIIPLQIRQVFPEGIVQDLEVEVNKEKAKNRLVQKIVQKLGPSKTKEPKLGLIEIDDYKNYKEKDPKQAVREGLARINRISQFIYPLQKEHAEYRLYKAVLDLLSDIGFRKVNWTKGQFNNIISLSIIKGKNNNQYLPVLTKIDNQEIMYKLYGSNQWKSLDECFLSIHKHTSFFSNPSKFNNESLRLKDFLRSNLMDILNSTDENVYFLVEASLRKGWIPGLKNGDMDVDVIPEIDSLLSSCSNLRVIRINTTADVPQYEIYENGSNINRSSGLFKDENDIYYSVGGRPDTMRSAKHQTKYQRPTVTIVKQSAVEMIVMGAAKEERDDIIRMIDNLRRTVITWDTHVKLPYPIHMVRSIKKYLSETVYDSYEEIFEDGVLIEENGQLVMDI